MNLFLINTIITLASVLNLFILYLWLAILLTAPFVLIGLLVASLVTSFAFLYLAVAHICLVFVVFVLAKNLLQDEEESGTPYENIHLPYRSE